MAALDNYLTVAEAAQELGIRPSGVHMAITYGTLRPVRIDRRTIMIERAEVERYKREHLGKRGRPKKKPAPSPEPAE
jgi:excisionase family DNA binding protein